MTDEARPEPLVPAHIDLRSFPFMPLHVHRLLTSETWIEAADHPFLGHALLSLWAASWHEVPAGSLPNKARVLARLAHRTLEEFGSIAEIVARQFVLCSDGRLYHPVVAEVAIEAWKHKKGDQDRTRAAREAKLRKKRQGSDNGCHRGSDNDRHDDRDDDSGRLQEKGQGQGEGQDPPSPPAPVAPVRAKRKPKRLSVDGTLDVFSPGFLAFWAAYPQKVKKQEAWNAWQRDGLDEFTKTLLRDVTERAARDDRWLRGFVPDPTTYINQRRWQDDLVAPKTGAHAAIAANEATAREWAGEDDGRE